MNCQFLLFQSLCVFLIASLAYGGELPSSITSQYTVCYEMKIVSLSRDDASTSPQDASDIDNLCVDSDRSAYHFLSSAQGGTTSVFTAPISKITIGLLLRHALGITLRLPSEPVVNLLCHFQDPSHALDVYNSIYESKSLNRENFTIDRIQQFELDPNTDDHISDTVLSQQATLYTEFYDDTKIILTFKEKSANDNVGNPVSILMAYRFNISDVLNKNVVLRYKGVTLIYFVLTFRDESEANHFWNSLRGYFNPDKLVSIPAEIQEVLETKRV